MIKIAIAEDHQIFRQGLKLLLLADKDFQIIWEAANGLEAIQLIEKTEPDVLILDVVMPKLNGLETIRQIRSKKRRLKIIILSTNFDEPCCLQAIQNGADGYVVKNTNASELIEAIRQVLRGKQYFSSLVSKRALLAPWNKPQVSISDPCSLLTERERSVLQLAAEGCGNAEIAIQLRISRRTAETHRANLMEKLNLHSQTDLVRFAIRNRITPA